MAFFETTGQQNPADQLANAKRLFDTLNYEQAAATLDQLVAGAPPPPVRDAELARVFASAYELRARARFFLGDAEGARERLTAIEGSPPDLFSPPAGCPYFERCPFAMQVCGPHDPPPWPVEPGH